MCYWNHSISIGCWIEGEMTKRMSTADSSFRGWKGDCHPFARKSTEGEGKKDGMDETPTAKSK